MHILDRNKSGLSYCIELKVKSESKGSKNDLKFGKDSQKDQGFLYIDHKGRKIKRGRHK